MGLPNILLLAAIQSQLSKETPPASRDNRNAKAMILRARLRTPVHLEGYVTLEIVLFRPMSYTQVWSRVVSTAVPIEGLAPEDGLLPGFDYVKAETPWHIHANHDSCWREGLDDVFKQYESEIVLFSGPYDWYEMVDATLLDLPRPDAARERQQRTNVSALPEGPTTTESDTWQSDAIPYCKVCHKTHGAVRGEKMCGGAGSWIPEQ